MSDSDKKKANDMLEEAVKEVLKARGAGDGFVVDWVLVTAEHIPHPDGSSATGTGIYGPEMQPTYRASGLLHYATVCVDDRIRRT